jgi:DNA (cytosine-5)-methyltransferase 1
MAGKRGGERDKPYVFDCLLELSQGNDCREDFAKRCEDPRSLLVCEPLRWTLALQPTWVAFEQVPPVLELWERVAAYLRDEGYHVWTGLLWTERYGVPQTRERAILMAHRSRPVEPPTATHRRYVPPPKEPDVIPLFDAGERQRIVHPGDEHLLPWVSMAEALGWDGVDVCAPTVTAGGGAAGGVEVFARGGRERLKRYYRNGNQPNAAKRPEDAPAPTLHFGHALNSGIEWTTTPDEPWTAQRPAPTIVTSRRSKDGLLVGRQMAEGEGENVGGWGWERPATSVNCDPRISPPGHHDANESGSQQKNAVRVTEQEAAILQGFPPDYPFQGSRTKRFEQIGNAVPPLLAEHILRQLVDAAELEAAA